MSVLVSVMCIWKSGVIGMDGDLPAYLREDMRRFRLITKSSTAHCIVGRKTYDSLPEPKLPGRTLQVYRGGQVEESTVSGELQWVIGGQHTLNSLNRSIQAQFLTFVGTDPRPLGARTEGVTYGNALRTRWGRWWPYDCGSWKDTWTLPQEVTPRRILKAPCRQLLLIRADCPKKAVRELLALRKQVMLPPALITDSVIAYQYAQALEKEAIQPYVVAPDRIQQMLKAEAMRIYPVRDLFPTQPAPTKGEL